MGKSNSKTRKPPVGIRFANVNQPNEIHISKDDEWINLEITCPYVNCNSRMNTCQWRCQMDQHELFISCYGIIECRNKTGRHSGRVIDWVFRHDDCSLKGREIDLQKLCTMLSTLRNQEYIDKLRLHLSKQYLTGSRHNCSFYAVTMDKDEMVEKYFFNFRERPINLVTECRLPVLFKDDNISVGLQTVKEDIVKAANNELDEIEHVDYSEYFDIQQFDFTKRPPPSLFKDDEISDSARDTCNTIVVGFEMTVSQHILFDGDVGTNSFDKTENSSNMLRDIKRNENMWFSGQKNEMFFRILKLKELLTAIQNRNHDEIMRIYYRSQYIHTFDDHSSPVNVQIYVDKYRLNSNWLPHIENAIEKISIAAPGLKFKYTNESFDGSSNYIKIGIDIKRIGIDLDLMDRAYTSYEGKFPFIHLGDNRPSDTMGGTSIHELLHALGFSHQMNRFDSHLYVNVNTDDLDDISAYQYRSNTVAFTRFDPFSIMMYPLNDNMKKADGDQIWKLKDGPERSQDLSELDKVALNLMYKPCKSDSKHSYSPVISETTKMLYCGRNVLQFHNQNVPPTRTSICGPSIWANCPSCRVFKDVKYLNGKTIRIRRVKRCLDQGKWQGLSGNIYCGKQFAGAFITFRYNKCIQSDGVCGPDQGIPCTNCGEELKPGYTYEEFNPIPDMTADQDLTQLPLQPASNASHSSYRILSSF